MVSADLVIGAHWGSEGGRNIVGRAYGLRGRAEWPDTLDMANRFGADWWVMGVGSEARMGSAVAAGDVSGDGIDDFIIGSLLANPFELGTGANVGGVYALLGAEGGGGRWDLLNTDPNIIIGGGTSSGGSDQLGTDLAVGDLNADGKTDLFGAAMNRDGRRGAVFGWFGPIADGTRIDGSTTEPDVLIEGVTSNGYLGSSVSIGDLDDDGIDDLVIGALNLGPLTPASNGAVVVFFGGAEFGGRHSLTEEPAPLTIIGPASSVLASAFSAGLCACRGRPIAVADVTGDGANDLVLGAIQGAERHGAAYVVAGPFGPGTIDLATHDHFEIIGPARDSRFGWSIEPGDLDSDGSMDLVISAPLADTMERPQAGRVFGFRGPLPPFGSLDAETGSELSISGRSEADGGAGISLVLADTDGDSHADLHIGLPDADPGGKLSVGEVHRLSGPLLERLSSPSPEPSFTPSPTLTAIATGTPSPVPTTTPTATLGVTPTPTSEPSPAAGSPTPDPTTEVPTGSAPPSNRLHSTRGPQILAKKRRPETAARRRSRSRR